MSVPSFAELPTMEEAGGRMRHAACPARLLQYLKYTRCPRGRLLFVFVTKESAVG